MSDVRFLLFPHKNTEQSLVKTPFLLVTIHDDRRRNFFSFQE